MRAMRNVYTSFFLSWVFVLGALFTGTSSPARAQAQETLPTTIGTVVSSTKNTMIVRTDEGVYRLFSFDHNTTKPATVDLNARVRVTWFPTDDPNVHLANLITIETGAAAPPAGAATAAQPEQVPADVRNLEKSIQNDFRKYRIGAYTGVALNPELVALGVNMQFGPLFSQNVYLRPSFEFAFGEVTNYIGLNGEVIFNLPYGTKTRRWVYAGFGPAFNFTERAFAGGTGTERVNFSDFNYSTALNVLLGVRYRGGLFFEAKTSIWAAPAPVFRLLVGYSF